MERVAELPFESLHEVLGAQPCVCEGERGTQFALWAPNARSVRVMIRDFMDGSLPMRRLSCVASVGSVSGIWAAFAPGVGPGAHYSFDVVDCNGKLCTKADPLARGVASSSHPSLSVVASPSNFQFTDAMWMQRRAVADMRRQPVAIYEVHLGSWRRSGDQLLNLQQLASPLVAHVKQLGFTHIELMPVAEHAYYGSWGYQSTGLYAVAARYGTPDELRTFVNFCHVHEVGVILDWCPVHFPADECGLTRLDGSLLYESDDAPTPWGTRKFDVSKPEVCSYLVSNALFWLKEFHFDGLRVDAVSWLIYSNYLLCPPPWAVDPDGVAFFRQLTDAVRMRAPPGAFTCAEEATSQIRVTSPSEEGGLGFTFKWNMGWMNDTLTHMRRPAASRGAHQDALTFAMTYEFSECFVNAISHDEVTHMKGSLLGKMPGCLTQRFADVRLLLAYQWGRPGKKLQFMGFELGSDQEWSHETSLPWLDKDECCSSTMRSVASPGKGAMCKDHSRCRAGLLRFIETLGALYLSSSCLWASDHDMRSFNWIDGSDKGNAVLSFIRYDRGSSAHLVFVFHFGESTCHGYRIGVPSQSPYQIVLNTDADQFGGCGIDADSGVSSEVLRIEPISFLGWRHSVRLTLPPRTALVLQPLCPHSVLQEPPDGCVPVPWPIAVPAVLPSR